MVFRQKNEKVLMAFALLAVLVLIAGCSSSQEGQDLVGRDNTDNSNTGSMKTFVLTGENFKFMMNGEENPDLVVKQGDTVKIEFTSVGGFHDFMIEEFNAKTSQVSDGESTSIEFTADEKGTFEYYCSVGSHRQMGMKGNFIVE